MRHNPKTETLNEFLSEERRLRDEIYETGIMLIEDLKHIIFLMSSMPAKYASIVQIWDTMKDLTSNKAISMLQNEELRQKQQESMDPQSSTSKKTKNLALQANSGNSGGEKTKKKKKSDRKGLHCDFCDIKDSHKEEDCWKKFPEKNPHKKDGETHANVALYLGFSKSPTS